MNTGAVDIGRRGQQGSSLRGCGRREADPVVSSDIIQDPRASIIDREMTQVVDGDLLKVMSWYDNEWGYASQMVRQAVSMAQILPVEPALSSL